MAYRNRVIRAIERLKMLSFGQFFRDYFEDGNYIHRRCRAVDSSDPRGPFYDPVGVKTTDPNLDGLTFEAIVDCDVFDRGPTTIPVRTIEGITGSGKTLLMNCLYETIHKRIRSDPANKVICTPPISCNGIEDWLGNYVRGFVWTVVDSINESFKKDFPDDYQYFRQSVKGTILTPLNLIEGFQLNGKPPSPAEQGLFSFDLIAEFATQISKREFKCVVLLDEMANFCDNMLKPSGSLSVFVSKCFGYLIDKTIDLKSDLLMIFAVIEDKLEGWLKSDGKEEGAFRRIEDRRLSLGAFDDNEKRDLIKALLDDYYLELCRSKLEGQTKEWAARYAQAIRSGTASVITKTAVKALNDELKIDPNTILKDWEEYQHKTGPVFLSTAKKIYFERTGQDAANLKISPLESEYPWGGHRFDHYVSIPYHNGSYHFFGETSKSNLTPKKYNREFKQLSDLFRGLGDRQFVILLAPRCTLLGEARAQDHGVTFVEVPLDENPKTDLDRIIGWIPEGLTPKKKARRIGFDRLFELARKKQPELDKDEMIEELRNCDRVECTSTQVGLRI